MTVLGENVRFGQRYQSSFSIVIIAGALTIQTACIESDFPIIAFYHLDIHQ